MNTSPGPWRWVDDDPILRNARLVTGDGTVVVDLGSSSWNEPAGGEIENEDDATLIASAPELLSMLRELEWAAGDDGGACPSCQIRCHHDSDCRLAALLGRFEK